MSTAPALAHEPLTVLFSARTDTGQVRTTNEDNFLVDRRLRLYVVCDGLGGHQGGEIASATAVGIVRDGVLKGREFVEAYERDRANEAPLLDLLASVVRIANERIFERGNNTANQRGMGTTLSLLLLAGARAFVAHVGDTRVYRLRDGQLVQLTEDHSLITEMRRGLYMTSEQIDALDARIKNQITRAVGVHDAVEADVFSVDLKAGDRFVLCSDGLHGQVSDVELAVLSAHGDLVEVASRLVDRANAAGGPDNITAIVVEVQAARTPTAPRQIWPIFEVVRTTSLFQGLADLELASLLERVQVTAVAAGEALVRDASPLPGLFVVLEGELQVLRQAEVVAVLRRGDFFAEDALIIERTSGTTVLGSAAGASVGIVERRHFDELQRTSPNVALKLAIAIGRSLARKVEASAREGGMLRVLYKDPGAMTRPVPRPVTNARILADTEPEPMARVAHDVGSPTATVLRRPRSLERRTASAVTQPAIPVMRGPGASDMPPPPLPRVEPAASGQPSARDPQMDLGLRLMGRADTIPVGPLLAGLNIPPPTQNKLRRGRDTGPSERPSMTSDDPEE